eukprot:CAMPEP_0115064218 /NCGR_PEP_ID=MMETSP0227-20121206/9555_1 /TAXON_ID=89957 /ORGANISM="Polarella glacialis, Strain CCMP 1383" /LENGTH=601 /DNA_ID=CAMNT_0002449835 /DNA_START=40 /DNA_END=1842 /DNA_ORIENTATION=+
MEGASKNMAVGSGAGAAKRTRTASVGPPVHKPEAGRTSASPASARAETKAATADPKLPPAEPSQVSAAAPAALVLFTLLWGQLQVAHMLKDLRGDFSALKPLPAIGLLLCLPAAFCPSLAHSVLPLASLGSGVYMFFHGSRSNHILQDLLINLAIFVAALSTWAAGRDGGMLRRLSAACSNYLVVLYLVSALHKLNSDFFDSKVSCASSVTATLLAQYLPTWAPAGSPQSQLLLWSAPYGGVALELLLPLLLWVSVQTNNNNQTTLHSSLLRRLTVCLGAVFHLALALPLPPASFYPFSASCLALYVLLLPDSVAEIAAIAQQRAPALSHACWLMLPTVSLALCAGANASGGWSRWLRDGEGRDAPFEYPAYDLYNAGISWSFLVTGLLVMLALFAPSEAKQISSPGKAAVPRVFCDSCASIVVGAGALVLGLSPYLGLRTYPAFAMFSNLRVEGSSPNHLLLGGGLDLLGLQRDSVHVLATNIPVLLNFQVDLAVLYTNRTTSSGMECALWICPPFWSQPPPASFTPFSAPAAELRRRLAAWEREGDDHWYARVLRNGKEFTIRRSDDLSVDCMGRLPARLCEFFIEAVAGPFRSFDDRH